MNVKFIVPYLVKGYQFDTYRKDPSILIKCCLFKQSVKFSVGERSDAAQ